MGIVELDEATYTCAHCRRTFPKAWTDAEADAEARASFGRDSTAPDMVCVCDDCYRALRDHFGPSGPGD